MDYLPYWLYAILMYPEDYQKLGVTLASLGLGMIFVGAIKLWW